MFDPRPHSATDAPEPPPDHTEFHLDLGPDYRPWMVGVSGHSEQVAPERLPDGQFALRLEPGEYVPTPPLRVGPEHVLQLEACGGTEHHPCDVAIHAELPDGSWHSLSTVNLHDALGRQSLQLGVGGVGEQRRFRIVAGAANTAPCWISTLRVCAKGRSGLVNARSGYAFRLQTEVRNFTGATYSHAMYGAQIQSDPSASIREASPRSDGIGHQYEAGIRAAALEQLARVEPQPGEATYFYAGRALGLLLPFSAPNFLLRAESLGRSKKSLRILSVLAGAARVEEQIVKYCGCPVTITLIDASEDLIRLAASRLRGIGDQVEVECLVGDINAGLPGDGQVDVVICVSALHHVVEIERVLAQINARLADDGEFWSIGEQIGRNGNRLWPEAYEVANREFQKLPARYRRNAHTGVTDDALTDQDFSLGCFEGVRSEELEYLLEAHFIPEHAYKRNAFLWRLVDATYGDNFDLQNPDDLAAIRELIAAEATHWCLGGRSTELHGVYRKKRFQISSAS